MFSSWRSVWVAVVALAACGYVAISFDWPTIISTIREFDATRFVLLTSLATLAVFGAGAVRWMAVSQLPWNIRDFARVYVYVALTTGIAVVTPLQLGELLKLRFARDSGLPVGRSAMNLALERIMDLSALGALVVGGLVHAAGGSSAVAGAAALCVLAPSFATPVLLRSAARRWSRTRLIAWLQPFIGPPMAFETVLVIAVATLVKWAVTVLAWVGLLHLAGISLKLLEGMLLVGSATLISVISLVPGGLGVQEISVRGILMSLGLDQVTAESGAVVLRLLTPVVVLLGLAHLLLFLRGGPRDGTKPSS